MGLSVSNSQRLLCWLPGRGGDTAVARDSSPTSLLQSSRYQREPVGGLWIPGSPGSRGTDFFPQWDHHPFSEGTVPLGSGRGHTLKPATLKVSCVPRGAGSAHCKVKSALPTQDALAVGTRDEKWLQFCEFSPKNLGFL